MVSLTELVRNMGTLEAKLRRFEEKFGVKSQEFYHAMTHGELDEFDDFDEYRMEFIEWLSLFKTWLSMDETYRQLMARQSASLQIKAHLQPAYA